MPGFMPPIANRLPTAGTTSPIIAAVTGPDQIVDNAVDTQHTAFGAITAGRMTLNSVNGFAPAIFSTAITGSFRVASTTQITTQTKTGFVFFPYQFKVSHSVGGAAFRFEILLFDTPDSSGVAYVGAGGPYDIRLPATANDVAVYAGLGLVNLAFVATVLPGLRRIEFDFWNTTAGTLTVFDGTFDFWDYFEFGGNV